jgi:hypothetical protein
VVSGVAHMTQNHKEIGASVSLIVGSEVEPALGTAVGITVGDSVAIGVVLCVGEILGSEVGTPRAICWS